MGVKMHSVLVGRGSKESFSIFVLRISYFIFFLTLRSTRLTISAVFKEKVLVKYWWISNYPWHFSTHYHIIVCNLSSSTIYFHIISIGKIFGKKCARNIKCIFFFILSKSLPVTFLTLGIIKQCTIIYVHRFSFQISTKHNFLNRCLEKPKL